MCTLCRYGLEMIEDIIKALKDEVASLKAEDKRLRDEIKRSTIWADEVSPFTPGQVHDLLVENYRFRNILQGCAECLEKVTIK